MKKEYILNCQSMPIACGSYGRPPYRFIDREYFIIAYESDPEAIRQAVPEPLQPNGSHVVSYEWNKMPDASGLGCYDESGIVIPCTFEGEECNFVAQMYVDDAPALLAGREIWGFPKKWAKPKMYIADTETLTGTLYYNDILVAIGTMPFKYGEVDKTIIEKVLIKTQVNLKLIPDVDGKPKVAQLAAYNLSHAVIKGAWSGPARLHLVPHVNAPLADLPVTRIIGGTHFIADVTLPYPKVIHDYLHEEP
jgi:acetoacetate decarboxylase